MGLIALLLSIAYHLQVPLAGVVAVETLTTILNREIQGELEVGELQNVTFEKLVARNVVLRDPQGRAVIEVDRLAAWPDWSALLDGVIRVDRARVQGGDVTLYVSGPDDGSVSIADAFLPVDPAPPDAPPSRAPQVIVDHIVLDDVLVHGDVPGLANLRVEDIRVEGRIEAQQDVRFRVFAGRGVLTGPYAGRTPIDQIVGHFDSDMTEGLDVFARVHRGEDRVAARIQLTRESEEATPEMDLQARVMPLHVSTLAEMEVIEPELADVVQGAVRGHVRLYGPTDDLRLRGDVGTAGGRVHLRAHLPEDGPLTFEAWTEDRLRVARLIDGAPETSIGGRARLTLEEEDPPGSGERVQRLHAEMEPLRIGEYAIPSFVVDGVIGEDAFEVERLDADLAGGEAHASGRVGFDGGMDVHVTARVPQLSAEPNVRRLAPDARGSLSLDLNLQADVGGENLRADGRIAMRDARYGSVHAATLNVRGHAAGLADGLPVVRLEGDATGFEIGELSLGEVDLTVTGGPERYEIDVRARDAEAGTAFALSGRADVTEQMITLRAPTLMVDLGPGEAWNGHVDLRFRPGHSVAVNPLMLSRDGERIVVDGIYRFQGEDDIDVEMENVNLAQLRPLAPDELENLGGRLDGRLSVEGDIDRRPQGRLTATIRDGSFRGVEDIEGTVDLALQGNQLDTNLQLALGELGEIAAEGPITISDAALRSPERILEEASLEGLRVRASGLDLRTVGLLGLVDDLPVMGRISTDIELAGRLDRPDLRDAVIILEQIAPDGWDPMRAKLRLSMEEGRVWLRQAWVADAHGALASGEAELPFSLTDPPDSLGTLWRQLNASTWSASLRLEQRRFDTWPRPLRDFVPPGLTGSASITADGDERGPRADFAAVGRFVEAAEGSVCGTELQPLVTVRGRLDGELAEARITGFLGGERPALEAEAYATLPLGDWAERGGVAEFPSTELTATVRDADLGQVPYVCEHARGPLTASITAKDLLTGRSVIGAVIDIPHLQIWETAGDEGEARLSTDFRVHVRAGSSPERDALTACAIMSVAEEATTPGAQCREVEEAAPGEMVSRLRVPVTWRAGELLPVYDEQSVISSWSDFANVRVEPVLTLVPGVVAGDALMDGEVLVAGPWGEMQLDGELAISDGHVQIEGLGQHLHDISGRVLLQGDRAVFPEGSPLVAHDSGGRVQLHGSVDFTGVVPRALDVTARADSFPVRREGMVLAWLSGGATVSGRILDERTTSRIRVRDFSVRLPEQSAATLQTLEPHPEILVVGSERPEGPQIVRESYPVEIDIDASDPFWVRRTDFAALVTANLHAVYQDPDLRVSGTAHIRRGTFEIFGKRFELTEGRMFFDGSPEMDPAVNVVAVYDVPGRSGATVTVRLTGTLTEPQVEFSSTETGDRAEIIGLLVSGGRRESGTAEQQASEQAASFLAGLTAGILTLGLRQEFGSVIPVLAIESQGVGGTRVRAGINADDLIPDFLRGFVRSAYIEGFVTAAAEGTNAAGSTSGSGGIGGGVTIELTLPESFLLRGTYVPVDNGSLDLFYEP